ncbi:transposase, partial [Singulisphaera rosea]
ADEPRPGAPRTITDANVEEVFTKTLAEKPKAAAHGSTRGMAETVGLSQSAIVRVWHAFGLKPHLSEALKLSTDPYFVETLRDAVGLYLSPLENAIVLPVDEKGQVQALDCTQPLLKMAPGEAERGTHDYVRNGTTSLFAALNVATGRVIGKGSDGIVPRSTSSSSRRSTRQRSASRGSRSTSSWTIMGPTRRPRRGDGSSGIRSIASASLRPAPRG